MIDRGYQDALIDAARLKLREIQARLDAQGIKRKPRLMVQLAAGGGKTHLAAKLSAASLAKGGRVSFLCHRDYLMFQTANTYAEYDIRHSYLAAGKPLNLRSRAHIGMIGSLKSRQGKIAPPTLAFSDEAHHGVAATWKEAIERWPDTTFIGLSATPGARTDGKGLDEVYDDIICGPQISELIRIGALSDFRYFVGRPIHELNDVKKVAGEYVAGKQAEILDKPTIIGDVIGTYRKLAMGEKAVYFAPNVKMSMDMAEAFTAAGLPFQHMDKDTPDWKRKSIARAIAKGELLGFTNVYIAGEGFDLAAQAGMKVNLKVTGLVHKTASLIRLIQEGMRCMRADDTGTPGKILDHCGNHNEHQWLPSDDIHWTLQGAERKPKLVADVRCPGCHAMLSASVHICPHCGTSADDEREAIERKRAEMEIIEGELLEVRRREEQEAAALEAAQKLDKRREEWQCKTLEDWRALAARRGLKPGWAWYRYNNQKRRA
jgi:DNA repair protein RadD